MEKQVTIKGWVDRAKKYTRKWASRWCQFDPVTRRFAYSEKEIKDGTDAATSASMIKSSIVVAKVTRVAEIQELSASSDELYSMLIEPAMDPSGASGSGGSSSSAESWSIRFKDADMYDMWYRVMRNSLAVAGLAEPFNVGLDDVDPRHGLPFARIPLPFLNKFVLLEKGIAYALQQMTITKYAPPPPQPGSDASSANAPPQVKPTGTVPTNTTDGIFVIGDRAVYFFLMNSTVIRCHALTNITGIHVSPNFPHIRIAVKEPEPDLFLTLPSFADVKIIEKLRDTLLVILRSGVGVKLNVTPFSNDTTLPKVEDCIKEANLWYDTTVYTMQVISPTSKTRLKQALDAYEKQHGEKFSAEKSRVKKPGSTGEKTPKRASSTGVPGASPTDGTAGTAADESLPLVRLLKEIGLTQYAAALLKQHVDIDVLQCMDLTDLETFGVKEKAHCEAILAAALDQSLVARVTTRENLNMSATFSGSTLGSPAAPPPSLANTTTLGASAVPRPQINLDDDEDEIEAMMAASRNGGGPASPMSTTTNRPVIILSDSDDDDLDLLPRPQAAAVVKPAEASSPLRPPQVIPDNEDL